MRQLQRAPAVLFPLVLVLAFGAARTARAQEEPPAAPQAVDAKLCALPSPASAPADKNTARLGRTLLEEAHAAYLRGDYATTLRALQNAYALEPGVDILYNMAQSCRAAGLLAQALPLYEEVLKHNPTAEQRQACQAKISELRPKLAEAENAQAVRALRAKQYEQAIAGFTQALHLSARPAYLFHLGEAQRLAGKSAEAAATYQRLLSESPSSPDAAEARRQLGVLKAQQLDEDASAHYEKAEYVQAVVSWDNAYQESPQPRYLFRKAEAMRQTGQRKEAAAAYERFLKISSGVEQADQRAEAARWARELREPEKTPGKPKPLYTRWWFWASVVGGAAVVAGVSAGIAVGSRPGNPFADVPAQNLRQINP
jgi:tetratricopeptide (TPR) repeat protein